MAVRKLAAGALAAPLAIGLVIGAPAVPAFADTAITAPSDGAVVTDGSSVLITASLDLLQHGALLLRGPGDDQPYTVAQGSGRLEYRLDISCPDYVGSCSGEHPAPNGTYTVSLVSGVLLERESENHTFELRIPPQPPEDVTAEVSGPDEVLLRWKQGPEPDLVGYDVLSSSGDELSSVSVDNACHDDRCAALLNVPASDAGQPIGLAVSARRRTAPDSHNTVASAPSKRVTVQIPAPRPHASGSSNLSHAPVTGNSDAAREPGGDAGSGSGLPSGLTVPQLAMPHLQPLASTSHLALPDVAGGNGILQPQSSSQLSQRSAPGSPGALSNSTASSDDSVTHPTALTTVGSMQLWKIVALGLVFLLVTAHLGTWTRRNHPAAVRSGRRRSPGRAKHSRGGRQG